MSKYSIKKICCIGAGYVGGPTMSVIAENCPNLVVEVVDINKEKINNWNDSDLRNLPVYEKGLTEIIQKVRNKNLFFSTSIQKAISTSDIVFISVNTPTKTKGLGAGKASDLKWVEECARQVARYAKGHTIVVEKSTIPVKTAATIQAILESSIKDKNDKKFAVLSNPEFLAEGNAIEDLKKPERILIGGDDKDAIKALKEIYLNWVESNKILETNLWSSELSKLVANAFLAQRISSINSISAICEVTGANINEVSLAIGMDSRIGSKFLKSGPGFGGSCFQKDILNLSYLCEYFGLNEVAEYWSQVIKINEWQKYRIYKEIIKRSFGTVNQKKLTIFGFAFKANTNDIRESPAIKICSDLLEEGAMLFIHDPKVKLSQIENEFNNRRINFSNQLFFSENIETAVKESHAVIILTEWEQYIKLNWQEIGSLMKSPSWIFDTRGILNRKDLLLSNINLWQVGYDNEEFSNLRNTSIK